MTGLRLLPALLLLLLPPSALGSSNRRVAALRRGPAVGSQNVRVLAPFVDPLVIPPVIDLRNANSYNITAHQTTQKFHRDLPPSKVYAYGTSWNTASVPGPTVFAYRFKPVTVYYRNNITDATPFLTVDPTIGAPQPPNGGVPMVPHLHGGVVQSYYDGNPDAWFTRAGDVGPAFNTTAYHYPNNQPPQTLWYHDHTVGMTSLNVAAGLAAFYFIRDEKKELPYNLPSGEFEVPLMLQDSSFFRNGSIDYPNVGDVPALHPNWVPEVYGDFLIVNGKVSPFFNAKRAKYLFRLLNGAIARFFLLSFHITSPPRSYLPFYVVSTDGGYLPEQVTSTTLLLAPGQRASIVLDLRFVPLNAQVTMRNTGQAPYPDGDYPTYQQQQVMRINVGKGFVPSPNPIPLHLRDTLPLDPAIANNYPAGRLVTLYEYDSSDGSSEGLVLQFKKWTDPATLRPKFNSSEIWRLVNFTPDNHPIHIHYVPHRVLSRQAFNVTALLKAQCTLQLPYNVPGSCYTEPEDPPTALETGFRDTTMAPPGYVTSVLLTFNPWAPVFDPNLTLTRIPFDPRKGPGYVIHCHILTHEDNDMMRPFVIT